MKVDLSFLKALPTSVLTWTASIELACPCAAFRQASSLDLTELVQKVY